jgi:hypothetical protein
MNLMAATSQRGQSMPAEETTGAGHEYHRHGSASTRAIDVGSRRHTWLKVLSTGHAVLGEHTPSLGDGCDVTERDTDQRRFHRGSKRAVPMIERGF